MGPSALKARLNADYISPQRTEATTLGPLHIDSSFGQGHFLGDKTTALNPQPH
jgi:hypothetical protein